MRIIKIIVTVTVFLLFLACGGDRQKVSVSDTVENPFKTFRDIPGITAQEIAAIELLQKEYPSFSFVMFPSTEAFMTENDGSGEYVVGGFTALLCEWLTDLFGIPFRPQLLLFNDMIAGLNDCTYDFTGTLTATEDRLKMYTMTTATITERQLKAMRLRGSDSLEHIALERLPRYALLRNSSNTDLVIEVTMPGTYESVYVDTVDDGYQALLDGRADVYFGPNVTVDSYPAPDVYTEAFFPLIFNPASMVTANPVFGPIISCVDKALKNGAIHYVNHLNKLGFEEYKKERLLSQLTAEERAYLRSTSTVPLAARYFNYPVAFYNTHEREWEGIVFDVLAEVEKYTGLKFEVVNREDTEFVDLLEMLQSGKAHIFADLPQTRSTEGRFLWGNANFMSNQYALLSKGEFPNISLNEIANARVGLIANTVHTEMFRTWFPAASNTREYATMDYGFLALERGEVDLIMTSKNRLLSFLNYYELSDYKANYLFNYVQTGFVFNKNQAVLRSITDKALPLIDTDTIVEQWMTKTYDYRAKVVEGRQPLFVGAIVLSAVVLALILFILYRTRGEGKRLATQVTIKTKEAMKASEAKTRFIANMSHEMRTPMNSIIGFSELAMNDADPIKTKEYLDKILINSELLLQIIDDVLDMSKIETGGMELENAPFDMHDLLTASQTMIAPKAREKEVNLYFYAEPSIGRKLVGDSLRLRQVLVNLLSNAVKFTGRNGIVKVSATVVELDGARHQSANECQAPNREKVPGTESGTESVTVRFEVKDSGIGMSPEQIEQIMQPFTQVDMATTRRFGGTGLGLAISKNIIERMGGKFMVESMLGVGSKFSFEVTFATAEAAADESGGRAIKENAAGSSQFKGEVLLCEDNDMNQQVLCEHLKKVGVKADIAENGREGYNMVRRRHEKGEKPYDLIFMDVHMPVMDGLEATRLILELNTGVPIVAMTANVMAHDRELYEKTGMKDCLGKPFRVQELYSFLAKYLRPEKWNGEIQAEDNQFNDKLKFTLMASFVKDNRMRYREFADALDSGDIKLAHRLVHTLKSNAALLGKTRLQKASEEAEHLLADGENRVPPELLNVLETELSAVLNELEPLVKENAPPAPVPTEQLDAETARAVLAELEPLLERGDSESLKYIDKLRGIPGTEKLIQQMEDLDFEDATETLSELGIRKQNV